MALRFHDLPSPMTLWRSEPTATKLEAGILRELNAETNAHSLGC